MDRDSSHLRGIGWRHDRWGRNLRRLSITGKVCSAMIPPEVSPTRFRFLAPLLRRSRRSRAVPIVGLALLTASAAFLGAGRAPVQAAQAAQAEIIRGPYLQNATLEGVDVRWELDRIGPSSLQVKGPDGSEKRVDSPFK